MGGNALSCGSVRLTKTDFEKLATDCVDKLLRLYPTNKVRAIGSYHSKSDFGDLDVLISSENYDPITAAKALSATEIVRNGPITSIGVDVPGGEGNTFQVDLIKIPHEKFDYAYNYFDFNDLGSLVGKIARSFGLKHGQNGLTLPLRDGTNEFAEITLTLDHDQTLKFLDLDVDQFKSGFETLEEMFVWVSRSRYFNPNAYALENLSHIGSHARQKAEHLSAVSEISEWLEW